MRKTYSKTLMTAFLFLGLLVFAVKADGNPETARITMQTFLTEEKDFLFETETIASPALPFMGQAAACAMLKGVVDAIQGCQMEAAYLRGAAIILASALSTLLLIGFGSGLFAYLIAGNKELDLIISFIRIIHQTDGKKRSAYSF